MKWETHGETMAHLKLHHIPDANYCNCVFLYITLDRYTRNDDMLELRIVTEAVNGDETWDFLEAFDSMEEAQEQGILYVNQAVSGAPARLEERKRRRGTL